MSEGTNAEALSCCFERLRSFLGEPVAEKVILIMAESLGGTRITFPDPLDLQLTQRDRMIREQFMGHNLQELSIRFNLSPRQVRNILKK